jgi:hypothetical protein
MPETTGCGGGDASENAPCRLRYGGNRKATPEKRQSSYLEWSSENSERVEYIANKSPRQKKGTKIKKHSE